MKNRLLLILLVLGVLANSCRTPSSSLTTSSFDSQIVGCWEPSTSNGESINGFGLCFTSSNMVCEFLTDCYGVRWKPDYGDVISDSLSYSIVADSILFLNTKKKVLEVYRILVIKVDTLALEGHTGKEQWFVRSKNGTIPIQIIPDYKLMDCYSDFEVRLDSIPKNDKE